MWYDLESPCWAISRRIHYLTVDKKATYWSLYRRPPRVHTRYRIPVFTRRDVHAARGSPKGLKRSKPEEAIFPARPEKGLASTKALRYHTGAPLPKRELRNLDSCFFRCLTGR